MPSAIVGRGGSRYRHFCTAEPPENRHGADNRGRHTIPKRPFLGVLNPLPLVTARKANDGAQKDIGSRTEQMVLSCGCRLDKAARPQPRQLPG